jgi:sensor domain CHASE-containing protein
MSVAGINSTNLLEYLNESVQSQTQTNPMQQMQQEFAQLGQDLQAGNLSAAQSDFATLQQASPMANAAAAVSTNTETSANPIQQAFAQLGQDLQAGNTTAAQQDFATIQQDVQQQTAQSSSSGQTEGHHHHHHGGGGNSSAESAQDSAISSAFDQLGQALQSGNLSSAQSLYSTLQQDFMQVGENATMGQPNASAVPNMVMPNAVSINA